MQGKSQEQLVYELGGPISNEGLSPNVNVITHNRQRRIPRR